MLGRKDARGTKSRWGIFISYRRGQTTGHARALHDQLEQRFGSGRVFMDVDAISPGADFQQKIDEAIKSCSVLLALIGPDWISDRGVDSTPLSDPHDFVRIELETALERNVEVIPVLIERTPIPHDVDLPESLRPITRRNALELENSRWQADFKRLTTALMLSTLGRTRHRNRVRRISVGLAILLILGLTGLLLLVTQPTPSPSATLLSLIPGEFRNNCSKMPRIDYFFSQEVAEYDCDGPTGSPVQLLAYELYPSHAAMMSAYQELVANNHATPNTSCGGSFTSFVDLCESDFNEDVANGVGRGRILEHLESNSALGGIVPVIDFTSDKDYVIQELVGNTSNNGDQLVNYWNSFPSFLTDKS